MNINNHGDLCSKNKRAKAPTIIPVEAGASIGQREMLSRTDCMKINSLYDCLAGRSSQQLNKIRLVCAMVGI